MEDKKYSALVVFVDVDRVDKFSYKKKIGSFSYMGISNNTIVDREFDRLRGIHKSPFKNELIKFVYPDKEPVKDTYLLPLMVIIPFNSNLLDSYSGSGASTRASSRTQLSIGNILYRFFSEAETEVFCYKQSNPDIYDLSDIIKGDVIDITGGSSIEMDDQNEFLVPRYKEARHHFLYFLYQYEGFGLEDDQNLNFWVIDKGSVAVIQGNIVPMQDLDKEINNMELRIREDSDIETKIDVALELTETREQYEDEKILTAGNLDITPKELEHYLDVKSKLIDINILSIKNLDRFKLLEYKFGKRSCSPNLKYFTHEVIPIDIITIWGQMMTVPIRLSQILFNKANGQVIDFSLEKSFEGLYAYIEVGEAIPYKKKGEENPLIQNMINSYQIVKWKDFRLFEYRKGKVLNEIMYSYYPHNNQYHGFSASRLLYQPLMNEFSRSGKLNLIVFEKGIGTLYENPVISLHRPNCSIQANETGNLGPGLRDFDLAITRGNVRAYSNIFLLGFLNWSKRFFFISSEAANEIERILN